MKEMTNSPINWTQWAEDMCKLTDDLAKENFKIGTPEYELQQSLIINAKRYRASKEGNK